jgi:hypothetical protein
MNLRKHVGILVPGAVAAVLVLTHFVAGGSQEPAPVAKKPTKARANAEERLSGAELDELKRQQWRESHQASILDVGEDAADKELHQAISRYGLSPLEFASDAAGQGGLRVLGVKEDLEKEIREIVAAGGSYSGPPIDLNSAGERKDR